MLRIGSSEKDTAPVFTYVFVYLAYKFFVSHMWNT